ncbi:MAG TPA: hypothetical protein VJ602_12300 [Paludibacter sp.]|nr:hypothetical protein [Paludibacter sp.]
MNTTFNFNRLGLLIKRYFIENKNKELIYWGILTLVFCFIHQADSAKMIIYIMGFIFAAKQFKIFTYTPSGMHYLLIPATHLEKLVASILLSTAYFFVTILFTYSIGNIIGTNLFNIFFNQSNPVSWELFSFTSEHSIGNSMHFMQVGPFFEMIIGFLAIQSIFLLGSIFFKGNAVGKTMLSIFGIFLALGIIEIFLLKTLFGGWSMSGDMLSLSLSADNSPTLTVIGYVFKTIGYLLIPFLWVVTYFRLTEKQV